MLARLLGTVDYHVNRTEAAWRRQNLERRREAYGLVRTWLGTKFARPISLTLAIFFAGLVWTAAAILPVPARLEGLIGLHPPSDPVAYFSALWSVQVAIAALVYPIVIAFVTILVQRQHGAKASLYIYLHDSAAITAGVSALFLVGLMTLQYSAITYVSVSTVVGWIGANVLWFIFNLLLTGYFLLRTFDFLMPTRRKAIIRRFAVSIAWPEEVRFHLAAHLFQSAVHRGLMPGPAYASDEAKTSPSVLLGSVGRDFGKSVVRPTSSLPLHVKSLRLRPLASATGRWLARARNAPAGGKRGYPVINFPIGPGDRCDPSDSLCMVDGPVEPNWFEVALIRLAYGFSKKTAESLELSVNDILGELQSEARTALELGDEEGFDQRVTEFAELFETLITVSSFTTDDGVRDNYTGIPDRNHVFGRPAYEVWGRRLLDMGEAAAKRVGASGRYIVRLAYVSSRLFDASYRYGDARMARYCINLPGALFHYLGLWWSRVIEEQGVSAHNCCAGAVLRPPYGAAYDDTMRDFVGAWESLKNDRFPPITNSVTWDEYGRSLDSFDQHLRETAVMLAKAVDRGDQAAAEWLATTLSNWFSQMEYRFDARHGTLLRESQVFADLLGEQWESVNTRLSLQEEFAFGGSQMEIVFVTAIKNFSDDAGAATAALLVLWGRDCNCETSIPAKLLNAFIHGGVTVRGGEAIRSLETLSSADALLQSIFHQLYSPGEAGSRYRQRLGGTISAIGDIRSPEMVPGRIYGGRGGLEGLDSLIDGWLLLLAVLAPVGWSPVRLVADRLRSLVHEDNNLFRRCVNDFRVWVDRIESPTFEEFRSIYGCLRADQQEGRDFANARADLRTGIESLRRELEEIQRGAIADELIDAGRLSEVERWASEVGFRKETGAFPLSIFRTITYTRELLDSRVLVIRGMEKGRFTVREMAQRAVNEHEWTAKTVRSHVGVSILSDALRQLKPSPQNVTGPAEYWALMKRFSTQATQANGFGGALVVGGLFSPRWLYAWTKRTDRDIDLVPPDLEFSRREQFAHVEGYAGHFGEVAVFQAPIGRGTSYLVPLAAFEQVTFTEYADDVYVRASTEPVAERPDLVDLRLTWARNLLIGEGKAVEIRVQEVKDNDPA